MKSAFVTGANGFVGSHLVDRLIQENYKVKCLVRKSSNLRWLDGKDVELVFGSLGDKESLKSGIDGCQIIYHVAGVLFGRSEDAFYKGNVLGTKNLLDAIKENNQKIERFLYVGTQAVVGPSPNGEKVDELSECKPLTWYGKSKLEAENLVISFMKDLSITIIRPGAVYGPRDYAIYEVFKTSQSGFNLKIGRSDKYVSFIHVDDLVTGIFDASTHNATIGEIYTIVNDDYNKQDDIAKYAIETFGKKIKTIHLPVVILKIIGKISDFIGNLLKKDMVLNSQKVLEITQDYWISSNAKAKKDFGFQPKWTLKDGVQMTAEWYRENKWLKY